MIINTSKVLRLKAALLEQGNIEVEVEEGIDSRQQASIARVSPFAETMFIMMMADGEAEEPELIAIKGALRILTDGLIGDDKLESLIQSFQDNISDCTPLQRLQVLGAQFNADRNEREIAFSLAAAVAAADDDFEAEELELMAQIAEWFGISDRRREAILGGELP